MDLQVFIMDMKAFLRHGLNNLPEMKILKIWRNDLGKAWKVYKNLFLKFIIMNIKELNEKYTKGELSKQCGNSKLKRNEFSPLFANLYQNKVVYHERFTCIVKLDHIELLPDRFEAIAIPHLLIEKGNRMDTLYPKKPWKFGASWDFLRLEKDVLLPYSSWLLWIDPDLVKQVEEFTIIRKFKEAKSLTLDAMWGGHAG